MASTAAVMVLNEMGDDFKAKFDNPKLTLQELDSIMSNFVE